MVANRTCARSAADRATREPAFAVGNGLPCQRRTRGGVARAAAFLLLLAVSSAHASQAAGTWREEPIAAPPYLGESLNIHVLLPPGYGAVRRYPVLYLNDGQDSEAVGLKPSLQRLHAEARIAPVIVVAIGMPRDRMGAYGLSDRRSVRSLVGDSRFGSVGTQAWAYSQWLARSLVPCIDARYRTLRKPGGRAILGWSLGGLNAFNIGWQYPRSFGIVGAFSPSFWLSRERNDAATVQRTRIAQHMVDVGAPRRGPRIWIAVGDREETADRDGDGIIDVVDDARDLIDGYRDDGMSLRGLRQRGYTSNLGVREYPSTTDTAAFRLIIGGEHNQASWARELPEFLAWAFPAADAE